MGKEFVFNCKNGRVIKIYVLVEDGKVQRFTAFDTGSEKTPINLPMCNFTCHKLKYTFQTPSARGVEWSNGSQVVLYEKEKSMTCCLYAKDSRNEFVMYHVTVPMEAVLSASNLQTYKCYLQKNAVMYDDYGAKDIVYSDQYVKDRYLEIELYIIETKVIVSTIDDNPVEDGRCNLATWNWPRYANATVKLTNNGQIKKIVIAAGSLRGHHNAETFEYNLIHMVKSIKAEANKDILLNLVPTDLFNIILAQL